MLSLLALSLGACRTPEPQSPPSASEGRRVLVIVNSSDIDSVRIGRYYAQKRNVPKENIVLLQTSRIEKIPRDQFVREIEGPVKDALAKTKNPIDFLLFVRGVPIRIVEGGYSIDSLLMSPGLPIEKLKVGKDTFDLSTNPYFQKNEPFTHARYGIYLSCRLDGYTPDDAQALIDRSLAAKPHKGPFLLDEADNRKSKIYGELQATLGHADEILRTKGLQTIYDTTATFAGPAEPVAGYASWGSNDGAFNADVYHALKFLPGAICETFVSTSGRTFRRNATGNQSLVADLISQGVTGVKGYVSEPYTIALAHADTLFDRYTSGFNLAESFYAASPVTHWKDVVIGDPLCAPYKK